MCFGPDLALNATSIEATDTHPTWLGVYDIPDDRPTHHSSWVSRDDESRQITSVRRNVIKYPPTQYAALRQELEVTDETGERFRFTGEAIAMGAIYSWANIAFHDSVYRWTDERGRVAHCTYHEIW